MQTPGGGGGGVVPIDPAPKCVLGQLGQPKFYTSLLAVTTPIISNIIFLNEPIEYLLTINVVFECCAMPT